MSWKNVDLNLLIIFDALMAERNVTRAGQKIGLSQPAVSAALAKLRKFFKDDLFIREAGGIKPTPRALELSIKCKYILGEIEKALSDTVTDPREMRMDLKVEMDAYAQLAYFPQLYSFLKTEAPDINIRLKTTNADGFRGDIEKFEPDLIFTTEYVDTQRHKVMEIMNDDYVLVTKKVYKGPKVTAEELVSQPHIELLGLTPQRLEIDRYLGPKGLYRSVQFKMVYPLPALQLLLSGEMACIVPQRAFAHWSKYMDLKSYELPFDISPLSLRMVCSASFHDCALFSWLVSKCIPNLRSEPYVFKPSHMPGR